MTNKTKLELNKNLSIRIITRSQSIENIKKTFKNNLEHYMNKGKSA